MTIDIFTLNYIYNKNNTIKLAELIIINIIITIIIKNRDDIYKLLQNELHICK